ncbi:MAG: hypothetical protein HYW79_02710 [Parcubacteria group bacterium]|nr:hypothetical protein [Parcubacteria group bacterium]
MPWCFAIVNNRLAEIYFKEKKNGRREIWAHCYVEKNDYKTKREQKWIAEDAKRMEVVYRNKKYQLIKT